MRVLFCTNAFERVSNGPAKFAHLLLREAEACGFQVHILTEDVIQSRANVHKLNLKIHPFFKLFGQFIRMWKYYKTSMAIRKDYPFDILVYNNAFIGLISAILFRPTAGMINDDNNATRSLKMVLFGSKKLTKHSVFYYLEYLTCKLMDCIIVNSEYLKGALAEQYPNREKLKVMYKGIENELVESDRELIIKDKEPGSVLFVKNDFKRGGLFDLIEALKGTNRSCKLWIVGPNAVSHDAIKSALKHSLIEYEIYEHLNQAEVYKLMRKAEIFSVPSHLEAFGVANLEAMALGCKIVSTNVGGIPEAVGGNGFTRLVKPGNSLELKNAVEDAFNTPLGSQLGAISEHLDKYKSTEVVSRFRDILKECV